MERARMAALEGLASGITEVKVARTLGVDRMTVRKWRGKR
jgi:transposase-like protein